MQSTPSPDRYPEYHCLLIAPNLGVEWLFDAARAYWDRFRPTVIPNFDLLPYLPPGVSIIVTVVAMRDYLPVAGVELGRVRPDAYFDGVVAATLEEAQTILDGRARSGQPFGVPIIEPTLTPPALDVSIPTPQIGAQGNFATYTPAPTPTPSQTPTPTNTGTVTPQPPTPAPIAITPGSVVGGG